MSISRLSTGDLLAAYQLAENFSMLRQALVGPNGKVAFLAVEKDLADVDSVVENVTVFFVDPPYVADPMAVFSDPGLRNLHGWLSPEEILADGIPKFEEVPEKKLLPTDFILVNLVNRSGVWLPTELRGFETLIP